jgi:AcrR family transcriptional regulator
MAAEPGRDAVPPAATDIQTRRRGERLERAIYDAVLHQLVTVGYPSLTMEGIAGCAQTGKAALYRRWGSKEDLVVEALENNLPSLAELPDHGSLRDDVLDVLRRITAIMNSPAGCALRCLLTESDKEHPFVKLVHERLLLPRKRMFRALLERAVERGEARPGVLGAGSLAADVGPAMIAQRYMAEGSPVPDEYVVSVVDDVVMPLLRP